MRTAYGVACLVLAASVNVSASAATLTVEQQDSNIFADRSGADAWSESVTISYDNDTASPTSLSTSAGLFRLSAQDGSPLSDFVAFCFEVRQTVNLPTTYDLVDVPDPTVENRVVDLYDTHFTDVVDSTTAAGFQLALWELSEDGGGTLADLDLTAGSFIVDSAPQAAIDEANIYLGSLDDIIAPAAKPVTLLEHPTEQDLITFSSSVPLPASAWLLLGGLGALGGLAARRRAARGAAGA
jgi:hypothetical protein